MSEPVYEVVWPLGKSACDVLQPASPVPDLRGKTVCELWDWLFNGDRVFQLLRQALSAGYPGIRFVDYTVFGDIHGRNEREVVNYLPKMLREHGCDVVITGMGA
ncbi:MAG: hypothetical protein ABIH46_10680 [Chloroflexota bacterium]